MNSKNKDQSRYAEALGIDLNRSGGTQPVGDCPFCGKPKHFYVSSENGCWDCKLCEESGNPVLLMTRLLKVMQKETPDSKWDELSDDRGIPTPALKAHGLAHNGTEWLLPYRSSTGNVVAVNRWNRQARSTRFLPGISVALFNADRLAEADPTHPVYLCEGEWDSIALAYALQEARAPGIAVGLPGAQTFKHEWTGRFDGRDVVIAFDHDVAGRSGLAKAVERLARARSVLAVNWPEDLPSGYDVRDLIVAAKDKPAAAVEQLQALIGPVTRSGGEGLVLRVVDDVEEREVEWLWSDRIPLGKITLVGGDPGLGKSFMTLDLAARVSAGLEWPDDRSSAEQGTVILISAEDDVEDTIRPRLRRMGADLRHVIAIDGVRRSGDEYPRPLSLDRDLGELEQKIIDRGDVRLIVIDPLDAFLGVHTDSHKSADVRRILAPLAALASRHQIAVLVVTHLNKNVNASDKAIYRMLGSIGMPAAARMVWAVTKDEHGLATAASTSKKGETLGCRWRRLLEQKSCSPWRLLLPVKANLAPEGRTTGLGFRIRDGRVEWSDQPVDLHADQAVRANPPKESKTPKADAADRILRDLLADGIVPQQRVIAKCRELGVARRTLRRAKERLGIASKQRSVGGKRSWFWGFPEQFSARTDAA